MRLSFILILSFTVSLFAADCPELFYKSISLNKKSQEGLENSIKFYLGFYKNRETKQSLIIIDHKNNVFDLTKQELEQLSELVAKRRFSASEEQISSLLALIPNHNQYTLTPGQHYNYSSYTEMSTEIKWFKHDLDNLIQKKEIMEGSHVRWSYVDKVEDEIKELEKKIAALEILQNRMKPKKN